MSWVDRFRGSVILTVAVAGQAFLALCAVNFWACFDFACYVLSNLNPVNTSASLLQMMLSFFLNGTETFPGTECRLLLLPEQKKIRNFAGALT